MTLTLSSGTSTAAGNAYIDAVVARVPGGTIKVYSGTRPTDPDTAVGGGTLLATFTLPTPAFGTASGKSATVGTIAAVTAAATGTAAWFRAANSSGTAQFDGDVGTSGADLNLSTTSLVSGGAVEITGGSIVAP